MAVSNKSPRSKVRDREAGDVYAYTVPADRIRALASSDLAGIGHVTVVSPKRLPSLRARRLKHFEIRTADTADAATKRESKPSVAIDAFAPDARARAILRGLDYAHADLKESGGAYDLAQVRKVMRGVSRQAIEKRVREGSLLAVPGPNNRRSYPTLQFNADGSIVDGLRAVRDALRTQNTWTSQGFLINPQDALGGHRPIARLRAGALEPVLQAARNTGEQGG
jgi:hypothetical protein